MSNVVGRSLYVVIGLACAIIFLALALYRVELRAVRDALVHANPLWLGAGLLTYAGNLLVRAWRWQLILRHVEKIRYGAVVKALVVGYGLNTILPARMGELLRAEFFKRSYGLSRVWALTSIVVERLLDGLTVVGCLAIGLAFLPLGSDSAHLLVILLLSAGGVFGAVLLALLLLAGPHLVQTMRRWPRLAGQVEMVQRGLEVVRDRRFLALLALTCLIYVPDTLSVWLVVKAVGVTLSVPDVLVLVGAASLSTLLPSAPAFVGNLQFAYALTMELIGASSAQGVAAATLAQLCLFLPVALAAVAILALESGKAVGLLGIKRRNANE